MSALDLAKQFFIEPASSCDIPATNVEPVALPADVSGMNFAVFAAEMDQSVSGFAAALALALARLSSSSVALQTVWSSGEDSAPSGMHCGCTLSARRVAKRLSASCGVEAVAKGRVVQVQLPSVPAQAVASLQRLRAAAELPIVTVFCGLREDSLNPLISRHCGAVVLNQESIDPLASELAQASLRGLIPKVVSCDLPQGVLTRALMLSGRLSLPAKELAVRLATEVRG